MKTPLRIAILQCDTPPPAVTDIYGKYDTIFTTLLTSAAKTLGLDPSKDLLLSAYDCVTLQEYPPIADIDAILISGSKYNSFDNDAWIVKLVAFTEKVLAQSRVRILGVCFGHQILGRALGAGVGRSDLGWEISVLPVNLTPLGKRIFGQETLAIHQMHKDIVFKYPPGVEALGSSPRCETQGMYVKNRFISVQGHPEFHEGIVRRLVEMRRDMGIFDEEMARDALARVGDKQDGVVIAGAFLRFLLEE